SNSCARPAPRNGSCSATTGLMDFSWSMADRRGTIRDVSSCPSEQPTVGLSVAVFFLGKRAVVECTNCSNQKNYFEQKRLSLRSRDGLDAHGHDQVSHARGAYPPVPWTGIAPRAKRVFMPPS